MKDISSFGMLPLFDKSWSAQSLLARLHSPHCEPFVLDTWFWIGPDVDQTQSVGMIQKGINEIVDNDWKKLFAQNYVCR